MKITLYPQQLKKGDVIDGRTLKRNATKIIGRGYVWLATFTNGTSEEYPLESHASVTVDRPGLVIVHGPARTSSHGRIAHPCGADSHEPCAPYGKPWQITCLAPRCKQWRDDFVKKAREQAKYYSGTETSYRDAKYYVDWSINMETGTATLRHNALGEYEVPLDRLDAFQSAISLLGTVAYHTIGTSLLSIRTIQEAYEEGFVLEDDGS